MNFSDVQWAKLFLGVFAIGTLMLITGALAWRVLEWWENVWSGTSYKPDKTSKSTVLAKPVLFPKQSKIKPYMSGLLAGDRKNPPKATFFGRLDGEMYGGSGPYEEKYLNTWEETYWNKQKRRANELKADSEAKTGETSQVVDKMGQTCEKLIEIAPKEVNNGKKA